jgi:hypothetical protein
MTRLNSNDEKGMRHDDNLTSQREELETLQSIYGDNLQNKLESKMCYEIQFLPLNHSSICSPLLTFQFWYPEAYPSHESPGYSIISNRITRQQKMEMDEQLRQMFEPGTMVMYQWIEHVRNFVYNELAEQDISQHVPNDIENNSESNSNPKYSSDDSKVIEALNIKHGNVYTEKKSTFVAHVAEVHSVEDVQLFLRELKQDKHIATATHNIVAYRFMKQNKATGEMLVEENRDDDGETGASQPVLFLLQRAQAINVCVVVTRWFGGVLMGSDRFRVITNVAKDLLQKEGYIKASGTHRP